MRFVLFISIVFAVLGLTSFYLGNWILTRWAWAAQRPVVLWSTVVFFLLLQFVSPYLYRTASPCPGSGLIHGSAYLSLGLFACLALYTIGIDVITYLWKFLLKPEDATSFDRRAFLTMGAMAIGSTALGTVQAAKGPQVSTVEIPIDNLPDGFDGFKIAQITDLHLGPTIDKTYLEDVIEKTKSLSADLIALTGDLVDGTVEQLGPTMDLLAGLKAPHGSYFVTGNHEYYWGAEDWIAKITSIGIRPLLNEHTILENGGSRLLLAGVTDHQAGSHLSHHVSSPEKALAGSHHTGTKILLAHQPASYEKAAASGFDLQLSGHTHGGQFFPFTILVKLAHKYYRGLYRHDKMWIYVSRGTGYWGPPVRFTVPSEITLVVLRKTKSV